MYYGGAAITPRLHNDRYESTGRAAYARIRRPIGTIHVFRIFWKIHELF